VVESAFAADGKVIVLYDADVYWQGFGTFQFGQFENLVALDPDGKKIWTAELPTNYPGDCYYEMRPGRPLVAYSWQSYICKIDIDTGKIVDREFTK
jgi:outer membrane protein assembly factor BamB